MQRHMELIKKDQIRVGGTVRIGAGEKNAPVRPLTPSGAVPHEPMQARIERAIRITRLLRSPAPAVRSLTFNVIM